MVARSATTDAVVDEVEALDAVRSSLRAALAAAPWPRDLVDVAVETLAEPTRALGGRLTPWAHLPLCCCAAACGDWQRALPAAATAELYATALDLLDDVEDGDLSATAARHGVPITLNLSTALLALAHTTLRAAGASPMACGAARQAQDALWAGLAVAVGGQHRDLATAGAPPLPVDECLDIARRKGGALAEACCRAGAAFGTDNPALIDRFGLLGCSLGLAGQLDNDMHDAGDGTRKSDLARRKQTVPIAAARAAARGGGEPAALDEAVWQGGIQLAYALMHAERARAEEALEAAATLCTDPPAARAALAPLLAPLGAAVAGEDL